MKGATMQGEEICWADAGAIAEAVQNGAVSAENVTAAILERIATIDKKLNAFVTVCAEEALNAARGVDAKRASGKALGPLAGVPVSLKDIILTKDIRTTAGSRLLETFVPDEDALLVSRLKAADAVIIGKTTTPEFCNKTVSDSPLTGETRNPWDLTRTPGGSSSGSAAAVAAGMGPLSIGTDGGGSIRLPAALCGVVGFKPTFGTVPSWPSIPCWDLLGHTGPMARSVADIQRVMAVIGGADPLDRETQIAWKKAPRGKPRVAWARTLDKLRPEPEVARALDAVVGVAKRHAKSCVETTVNWTDPDQQFRVIVLSDIAAALGDKLASEDNRAAMDPMLIQMIEFGQTLKGSDVARAFAWRRAFSRQVLALFENVDILIVPTTPVTAFDLGMLGPRVISGEKTSPYALFNWTWPFNATGQPALSLPVFNDGALPAGIQIIGRPGEDERVLAFARELETQLDSGRTRRPQI